MTLADLAALVDSGEAVLFTGAGFSSDACDQRGRPLPRSIDLRAELWAMLFGDEPLDDSSLADLVDVALARQPGRVLDYLQARLTVGDEFVPAYYQHWLAAPWRRVYTLNVDDLEQAVARRYSLPCPPRSITSADEVDPRSARGALEVVHLNGFVRDVARATFSTSQNAARLTRPDPLYALLCDDLLKRPFVFAGTVLDEPVFWQHVAGLRGRDVDGRPPSLLITRHLSRARRLLLERLNIAWVPTTVEEAADAIIAASRCAP